MALPEDWSPVGCVSLGWAGRGGGRVSPEADLPGQPLGWVVLACEEVGQAEAPE